MNTAALWAALGRTSAVLPRLIVERYAGGRSQRAMESAWEKALGQWVGAKSAGSDITDRLTPAYEAFGPVTAAAMTWPLC